METFTFWSALAGGMVIGGAAVALYALNGHVAGISGILGGAVFPQGEVDAADERGWRWYFLAGLVAGGAVLRAVNPSLFSVPDAGFVALTVAGLLVGVGATVGNGCTSGHGVCGLSRRSPRSLAAVLTFMAVAGAVVFVTRHLGAPS